MTRVVACSSRTLATSQLSSVMLGCAPHLFNKTLRQKYWGPTVRWGGLFHTSTDDNLTSVDNSKKRAKNLGVAAPSLQCYVKSKTWLTPYPRLQCSPPPSDSWKKKPFPSKQASQTRPVFPVSCVISWAEILPCEPKDLPALKLWAGWHFKNIFNILKYLFMY